MILQFSRLVCLQLAAAIALVPVIASAQNGAPPRRAKVITPVENVKELYVAIMGEVAKPGTYHLDGPSLKLQTVVERAGGLTSDASMTVRVVRQGRVSHKEIFSPQASTPLFPGDLLIVDPRQSVAKFNSSVDFAPEPTTIHASYEERATGGGIQVALLNLVDYPLVLRLRPQDANATNIVEKLGQSIELLANTYVITPDTFPRSSSESAKRAVRLAEGSVMVFERDRVNRNRLPATLPKPIESDIAMGAQYGLMGSPTGQSPELRNLGQKMASSDSDAVDFSSQFRQRLTLESSPPPPPDIGQPVNERKPEGPRSISTSKPRIANLPFTGVPRITNSSTGESQSNSTPVEPIPAPDDSADEPSSPTVAQPPAIEETVTRPSARFSNLPVPIIFLIVGALIGCALVVRQILESQSSDLRSAPFSIPENAAPLKATPPIGQTSAKPLLERLIKNELPVIMEIVEFPGGLALQGRIAPKPILRVDGPQSILKQNRPHFDAPNRSSSDAALREMIAQLDTPETSTVRRPHFMQVDQKKVTPSVAAVRERSEVAVGPTEERSKAPLAKALFQLEQGDVS